MNGRTEEYRLKKQAYKKEKRRNVTLWKRLGLTFLILSLVLTLASAAALVFDQAVARITGDRLWELDQADPAAKYYTSDYETPEAWQIAKENLQKQIGEQGLVLLKNADNTLPLAEGTTLRLEGGSESLVTALQHRGFQVTEDGQIIVATVNSDTKQSHLLPLAELRTAGKIQKLILLVTADADPALWQEIPADGVLYFPVWSEELIAQVLAGQVNPSGSLAVPVCADQSQDLEGAYCAAVIAGEQTEYAEQVAYPLGWGLHYTDFEYGTPVLTCEKETITVTVEVTNQGAMLGREILQIYVAEPGGRLTLAGFEKTDMLEGGAKQTVTVSVTMNPWMQAGEYFFIAAANAHDAANHYLAALGHTPENTEGRMDAPGDSKLIAKWKKPQQVRAMTKYDTTTAPVMGAKNGVKLQALRGLSYNAPQWEQLLDQLSFQDMVSLVSDGGFYLPAVESVNAPGCLVDSGRTKTELPLAGAALATTWDRDLAYKQGKLSGNWYLEREIAIVNADQAGLCSTGYVCISQALASAQTKGIGEKGVVVANFNAITPKIGDWQGNVNHVSICADLNYLPAVLELFQKKEDPATLWALRNACHRNLYALVNSAAMNHVGADTVVTEKLPVVVWVLLIGAGVCWVAFAVFAIFWHKGKENWKNTQEYLDFKELKK